MPNYIKDVQQRFVYPPPTNPQNSPHEHAPIQCRIKTRQYAVAKDISAFLDKKDLKHVQQVVGSLLYYARALDGNMLPVLNTIGSE